MKTEVRQKVWKKYDCKCAYCGEDLEYKKMQVDHIEPKNKGGKDDIENYNPSCRQCNFYKGTFNLNEFKQQLATITERIQKPFIVRLAMKYGIISFKPFDGLFYFEKREKQCNIPVVGKQSEQLPNNKVNKVDWSKLENKGLDKPLINWD